MISKKFFNATDALSSLVPGARWTMANDDYDTLEWMDDSFVKPSKKEVEDKIKQLQYEYDVLEYQRLRAAEYPPYVDYLDGVVKGDQAQIDAYIAACLAVKEKYPKPE